jgi:hypothetical protein
MRVPPLIAAALLLAACGKNGQADQTQNADDNLTADSIVSNDVTAIDAVTGDAANMAADVDMNFGNLEASGNDSSGNETITKPARPSPRPAPATAPAPAAKPTLVENTTNAASNAE